MEAIMNKTCGVKPRSIICNISLLILSLFPWFYSILVLIFLILYSKSELERQDNLDIGNLIIFENVFNVVTFMFIGRATIQCFCDISDTRIFPWILIACAIQVFIMIFEIISYANRLYNDPYTPLYFIVLLHLHILFLGIGISICFFIVRAFWEFCGCAKSDVDNSTSVNAKSDASGDVDGDVRDDIGNDARNKFDCNEVKVYENTNDKVDHFKVGDENNNIIIPSAPDLEQLNTVEEHDLL